MIVIVGISHSYTSAIAKFLKDNGADMINTTGLNSRFGYVGYEDTDLIEWCSKKQKFKKTYFKIKSGIYKYPHLGFFIKDIPSDVKVVYCLRNPEDIINSHHKKYGRGFHFTFNRFCYIYEQVSSSDNDVYVLMTEKILNKDKNEAKRLLDFCELKSDDIKFDFGVLNKRTQSYKEFRLFNLIWKILYRIKRG